MVWIHDSGNLRLHDEQMQVEFLFYSRNYDNIKWLGGTGFNIVENTLIRLTGYYVFQLAVMVPFYVKSLTILSGYEWSLHYLKIYNLYLYNGDWSELISTTNVLSLWISILEMHSIELPSFSLWSVPWIHNVSIQKWQWPIWYILLTFGFTELHIHLSNSLNEYEKKSPFFLRLILHNFDDHKIFST